LITTGFLITDSSLFSFSPKPLEKSWKMADSSSASILILPPLREAVAPEADDMGNRAQLFA
jgi:hypothetical protein